MSNDEEMFLDQARRALDRAADGIDAITAAKLRAARLRALDTGHPPLWRRRWFLAVGGLAMAGLVAVVAGLLWFTPPAGTGAAVATADPEDLELLGSQDNPDFYADLDFYEWLASRGKA
jgi:ferric-dicitrate binding protein FerR (iron transport regulator)